MTNDRMYPDGIMREGIGQQICPMNEWEYDRNERWIYKMGRIKSIACEIGTFGSTDRFELGNWKMPDWYKTDWYALRVEPEKGWTYRLRFPSMGIMLTPVHYAKISYVSEEHMKLLTRRYLRWIQCVELGRMVIEKAYKERGLEDELRKKHDKRFNSLLGLATLGREVAPYEGSHTGEHYDPLVNATMKITIF